MEGGGKLRGKFDPMNENGVVGRSTKGANCQESGVWVTPKEGTKKKRGGGLGACVGFLAMGPILIVVQHRKGTTNGASRAG